MFIADITSDVVLCLISQNVLVIWYPKYRNQNYWRIVLMSLLDLLIDVDTIHAVKIIFKKAYILVSMV